MLQFKSFLLILITNSSIFSQSLITDRPDQTESALTVSKNSLQIESGIIYENLKEDGVYTNNYSIAGTLLRYGLTDILELRLGAAYLISKSRITNLGFENVLTGIKLNLSTEDEGVFDFGLFAHVYLPIGRSYFTSPSLEPEFIAAISKSLSDNISLSGNLGSIYNSSIRKAVFFYTTALGISLSNELGMFIEIYGEMISEINTTNYIDAGFTFLISNNLQIDISAGKEISESASAWFLSTGVSIRFNKL